MNIVTELRGEPSRQDFEAIVAAAKPVVFKGICNQFPAFQKWTTSYLTSPEFFDRVGDIKVPVCVHSAKTGSIADEKGKFDIQEMSFYNVLGSLLEGDGEKEKYYITQLGIDKFEELKKDFRIPDFLPTRGLLPMNMWIGRNSVSPIHYDMSDNLLCQLRGRKKLIVIEPKYAGFLYMSRKSKGFNSPVNNAETPDLKRFPLFAKAPKMEFDLEEGDALFLPQNWFHYVRSFGFSISVNFWWSDMLAGIGDM